MTELPCPLPQVQEALAPYIYSRQETLRIRQVLTEFLQSQLPSTEQLPTNLNLTFPSSDLKKKEAPTELTGLRKKYWEALQAHIAAKERRDALNAELNQLRESHIKIRDEPLNDSPHTDDGIKSYIALLHQRRRHRKLQILQLALDNIADTEPNPTRRDFQQWLKDKLGEAPYPPADIASDETSETGLKDQILRLKKELLQAKHSVDEENKLRSATQEQLTSVPKPSIEAQVYALRCARDELINWIECELAKIAEHDTAEEKAQYPGSRRGSLSDIPYQDQVESLYERYVSTRASLVTAVEAAAAATKDANAISEKSPPTATLKDTEEPVAKSLLPSEVFPYIPALLQVSQDERTLFQQTNYLRHQLASAQEETRQMMQRLANESHLVPPVADSASFWAHAARNASKETKAFVEDQLKAGETNISAAKAILAELEARKKAFNRLEANV